MLSLFFSTSLQKGDDQIPDKKGEQDNFHCAESFFALHDFPPIQNALPFIIANQRTQSS
jgi:hypothetical protein